MEMILRFGSIALWGAVTIALSIVGALIFAVFLSHHTDAIRSWLQRIRSSRLKRRYVRVFIGAVRGEAKATDSWTLAVLLTAITIVYLSVVMITFMSIFSGIESLDRNIASASAMKDGETKTESTRNLEIELQKNLEEAQGLKADLEFGAYMGVPFLALALSSYLWTQWRIPFVSFRSRFSHELDRFTLRIQGLATKAELAQLAEAEASVRDEKTAKQYVEKMYIIANRHKVGRLVDTFLLWDTPTAEAEMPPAIKTD